MILFLDCDGVFHRRDEGDESRLFAAEKISVIEDVLMDKPDTDIVISTAWRIDSHRARLYSRLPQIIKDHVIGETPIFPYSYGLGPPEGHREAEIQLYLEKHAPFRPWIAIDDQEYLFYPGAPLYHVDGTRALSATDKDGIISLMEEERQRPIEEILLRRNYVMAEHETYFRMLDPSHELYRGGLSSPLPALADPTI